MSYQHPTRHGNTFHARLHPPGHRSRPRAGSEKIANPASNAASAIRLHVMVGHRAGIAGTLLVPHQPDRERYPDGRLNRPIASQFLAALSMLAECVENCPDEHWDGRPPHVVGEYPFWMVAYHTLCYVDCYLATSNQRFEAEVNERQPGFHPAGMKELSEEFPSRRFERDEIRRYVAFCRDRVRTVLNSETDATLAGASGFHWLDMPRAELHLYNLRHLSHHTGQLTAFLRRVGVGTKWVKAGWRATEPRP